MVISVSLVLVFAIAAWVLYRYRASSSIILRSNGFLMSLPLCRGWMATSLPDFHEPCSAIGLGRLAWRISSVNRLPYFRRLLQQ